MSRYLRPLLFLFALAFVAGLARDASADSATAEALFKEGKRLMGEKKYAEACAKFEESNKEDPGLGTQNNLAYCYAEMGRTASAWSLYLDVASQAKATNQAEREKKARDAAKALEPKLSMLKIQVPTPAEGIEVKRNGAAVGKATWGTSVPVDPGEIKITAVAPGKKLWEDTIKIDKPGETTVTVPELEKGEPPPGYYPPPGATGTVSGYQGGQLPPPVPLMKRRSSGLFGGGIAMIVVGSLTTVVGAGWLAVASTDFGDGDIAAPAGTTVFGLALLGGGIAMVVIGGKKVPVDPSKQATTAFPPIDPVPEVRLGFGSAQAKWTF